MTTTEHLNSVRAFVRNFNVVVKQVNLYGLNHKQVAPQLQTAWKELRTALASGKLMLTGAGDHLLLNGKPISAGSADKAMAQLLSGSGLAGVCFLPDINFDQFGEFVRIVAVTKSQDLTATFKQQFGTRAAVRLLEFHIGGEETNEQGMHLAGHIAAAMLGTAPDVTSTKPATTADLLRVLVAMDAKGSGNGSASATAVVEPARDLGEEDVLQTIRWLAKLGGAQQPETDGGNAGVETLPAVAQDALRRALASPATEQLDPEQPALVSLAEQLAVKMALDKYERGEIQLNAVQQLLQRLKQEIAKLHGVIQSHEDKLFQAGIAAESESDALDQQFWAKVPARNKLQVLLSPEGYCVPVANVSSFIDELLENNDSNVAEQVLRNYCALLRGDAEPEPKLKIARGICALAASYAKVSDRVLQWAIAVVASALSKNLSGDLGIALMKAMGALGREIAARKNYPVLQDYFDQLSGLNGLSEQVGERIWVEAEIGATACSFVDDAVNALEPKPDLLAALKQMPGAVANELENRAASCTKREDYRRLTVLARELGGPVLDLLKETAKGAKPERALLASGLLAASDALFVEEILKRRMPGWAPSEQAATIHQIACSGIPDRGVLLTQLFESFHELILPQAIDEIGISGSADVDKLVEITGRKGKASPFIQLKVIEALGNLKAKGAVPLLRHMVLARSVFKFEYARETRIVAMQAMLKVDALSARETLSRSGLTSDDVQLAPLRPGVGDWVRQRRYARIPIEGSVFASVTSSAGSCNISLEAMSMGGGGGRTTSKPSLAPDGMVEMQFGLRKLRARVLLHPIDTYKLGFEIASIPLDDRTRLRQFLASQARA
jgi:hypothetical protein